MPESQIQVTLVDSMGSDVSVVNAARVSFGKRVEGPLTIKDARLISYLARNNHWTPFGHVTATVHVKAPIFLARQLAKHQVGLVWNEISRRYVDDEPEFYSPDFWRSRPEGSLKQGSGSDLPVHVQLEANDHWLSAIHSDVHSYQELLKAGVAPEMARMVLPQSIMTEWYWTGSLAAFARVYQQRSDYHAQHEAQVFAKALNSAVGPVAPVSWVNLVEPEIPENVA